jgi:hypothetical protein
MQDYGSNMIQLLVPIDRHPTSTILEGIAIDIFYIYIQDMVMGMGTVILSLGT